MTDEVNASESLMTKMITCRRPYVEVSSQSKSLRRTKVHHHTIFTPAE